MITQMDTLHKKVIIKGAATNPLAVTSQISDVNHRRMVYWLKCLNAPRDTQLAIITAANATNKEAHKTLAKMLQLFVHLTDEKPVIRPPSYNTGPGPVSYSFGPAPSGVTLRYEASTVSAPDVTSSSPIWDYTSSGARQSSGSSAFIIKARYFVGSTPVSPQVINYYRTNPPSGRPAPQVDKATFITAFKRRAAIGIAGLQVVGIQNAWSWVDDPGPVIAPRLPPAPTPAPGRTPAPPITVTPPPPRIAPVPLPPIAEVD